MSRGEYCEGMGDCGTDSQANNCAYPTTNGGSITFNIYVRMSNCTSTVPMPPALPPPPPMPACDLSSCDAGTACGFCLRKLTQLSQCPDGPHAITTPKCDPGRVGIGTLCEGDGQCGTDPAANNCRYYEPATYTYHDWDVYERLPCILSPSPYAGIAAVCDRGACTPPVPAGSLA